MQSTVMQPDFFDTDYTFVQRILSVRASCTDVSRCKETCSQPCKRSTNSSQSSLQTRSDTSSSINNQGRFGVLGGDPNQGNTYRVLSTLLLPEAVDKDQVTPPQSNKLCALNSLNVHADTQRNPKDGATLSGISYVLPSVKEDLPRWTEGRNSPVSPASATSGMQRAMEKGAPPVRRQRNMSIASDITHSRSESGADLGQDAKATALRRDVVRRTLSALGFPTSAGVAAFVDRCEAAAVLSAQTSGDGGGVDRSAHTTTTISTGSIESRSENEQVPDAPPPPPVSAPRTPVGRAPHRGRAWFPDSPVATTFGTFLQLLHAAPPSPALAAALPGHETPNVASDSTTQASSTDRGQRSCITPIGSLPPVEMSTEAASLGGSTLCLPPPPLPPPPPPPPPYMETATPHSTFGAGNFTSEQDVVAHVRLALPWSIWVTERRCRTSAGAPELGDDVDLPPLPSPTVPMSTAQHRTPVGCVLPLATRHVPRNTSSSTDISSAPSCEATLVSDHLDAVLPTWAFMSSHIADATLPTVATSVPPAVSTRDSSVTFASIGSSRNRCSHSQSYSYSSGLSNSLAGGFSLPQVSTLGSQLNIEESVRREACLFPCALAEACAQGRQQRLQSTTQAAASSPVPSSLHLLRLELQVHVQHILPTVRNVAPTERQHLLSKALAGFAQTGVLPTTLLRGVLNDAALRLLASVDNAVLGRVAGEVDLVSKAESRSHKDDAPNASSNSTTVSQAGCQRVTPLSLHVETLQVETGFASASSTARHQLSSFEHPVKDSTLSEEIDSQRHTVAATTTTPTRVILTVLVHAQNNVMLFTSSEAQETPTTHGGQMPQANGEDVAGSSRREEASLLSSPAGATASMDPRAAVSLASVVIPRLFPLAFGLSHFATKLSLSSALDYNVLRTAMKPAHPGKMPRPTAGAENKEAATVAAKHSNAVTEPSEGRAPKTVKGAASSPDADAAVLPWSWQDISLDAVRDRCGLPNQKPSPPPTVRTCCTFSSVLSRGMCSPASGASSAVQSRSLPHSQRSLKSLKSHAGVVGITSLTCASTTARSATAAVCSTPSVSKDASDAVMPKLVGSDPWVRGGLCERLEEKVVLDDRKSTPESLSVGDAREESAELRRVAESVYRCVEVLCSHAGPLGELIELGEADTESGDDAVGSYPGARGAQGPQIWKRVGQHCAQAPLATNCPLRANVSHGRYRDREDVGLKAVMAAAQQAFVCGVTRLITAGLAMPESDNRRKLLDMVERAVSWTPEGDGECSPSTSGTGGGDGSAVASGSGLLRPIPPWLCLYSCYLTDRVCVPLGQLEASFAQTTTGATEASQRSAPNPATSKESNLGHSANATRRVVPGAQLVVKNTHRHRHGHRSAGRKAVQNDQRHTGIEGKENACEYIVDYPLPSAWSIVRASVQLCRTVAAKAATLQYGPATVDIEKVSINPHRPTKDFSGSASELTTFSPTSLHCRHHHSSVSGFKDATLGAVGETQDDVHAPHKCVASLIRATTSVLQLLEAEERRWVSLQEQLACLQGHWRDTQLIIREEGLQWCLLRQLSLVTAEETIRGTLAAHEAHSWSSIVEGRVPDVLIRVSTSVGPEVDEMAVTGSQSSCLSHSHSSQPNTQTPQPTPSSVSGLSEVNFLSLSLELPQLTGMSKESRDEASTGGSDDSLGLVARGALRSPTPSFEPTVGGGERGERVVRVPAARCGAVARELVMTNNSEKGGCDSNGGVEKFTFRMAEHTSVAVGAETSPPSASHSTAAPSRLPVSPMPQTVSQCIQRKRKGRSNQWRQASIIQPQPQSNDCDKAPGLRSRASQDSTRNPSRDTRALTVAEACSSKPSKRRGSVAEVDAVSTMPEKDVPVLVFRQRQQRCWPAPVYMNVVLLRQAALFVAVCAFLLMLLVMF